MKHAYERIVYLPPDLAIVYALEQNFRLDIDRGNIAINRWEFERDAYLREAIDVINDQGFNYYPGQNNEPWLHVECAGLSKIQTSQSSALIELFNLYYNRAITCKEVGFKIPDPELVNTPILVSRYICAVSKKFEVH